MDVESRPEAEATPPGVDWGSLIWPGGRPTGDTQVLADRAAAAAAIAARAEDPAQPAQAAPARGRAGAAWTPTALAVRPQPTAPVAPVAPVVASTPIEAPVAAPAETSEPTRAQTATQVAEAITATRVAEPIAQPGPEREVEPWNPEATYASLVRLLAELKAMHPDEVAVLPRRPARRLPLPRSLPRPGRLVAAVVAVAVLVGAVSA
jgi:hypothetical protein